MKNMNTRLQTRPQAAVSSICVTGNGHFKGTLTVLNLVLIIYYNGVNLNRGSLLFSFSRSLNINTFMIMSYMVFYI